MMNNKIALIIPYFGKLPNWFDLFLLSCGNNPSIHFILFTDDESSFNYPANFKVVYLKFSELQQLFKSKLNDEAIYIGHPYKLCDYRPCYGLVLSDYLSEYDFWGHCDIDLIFGDIEKYLSKIELANFDRLFPYGHFSLYRNIEKVNNAFRIKLGKKYPKVFDFDFVSKTTYPCYFDEVGMNLIFKRNEFTFYEKFFSANVNMYFKRFRLGAGRYDAQTLLLYKNKSVYEYKKKESIEVKEYMYIHLQNRKDIQFYHDIENDFIMSDEKFIPFDEDKLDFYFDSIGTKESDEEQRAYSEKLNKSLKNKSKDKFINELRYKKIKIVSSIINRYLAVKYLKNNNVK